MPRNDHMASAMVVTNARLHVDRQIKQTCARQGPDGRRPDALTQASTRPPYSCPAGRRPRYPIPTRGPRRSAPRSASRRMPASRGRCQIREESQRFGSSSIITTFVQQIQCEGDGRGQEQRALRPHARPVDRCRESGRWRTDHVHGFLLEEGDRAVRVLGRPVRSAGGGMRRKVVPRLARHKESSLNSPTKTTARSTLPLQAERTN